MNLSEFLLARIAEDEAGAVTARDGDDWHGRDECNVCDATYAARAKYGDPARVLAECEAKRAIVNLHGDDHECSTFDHNGERDNCTWVIGDDCSTMRLLALPYADHPDYDRAWQMEVAA